MRTKRNGAGTNKQRHRDPMAAFQAESAHKRKKRRGGRCKSLIRLDSDKEIKVNSFDFLWPDFAGFGLGLVEFGFGFEKPNRPAAPIPRCGR
jgi:hypothetical protein